MLHDHKIEGVTKRKRQKIPEQNSSSSHLHPLVEILKIIQFKAGTRNGKFQHYELKVKKKMLSTLWLMSFGEKLHEALAKDHATSSTLKILLMHAIKPGKDGETKTFFVNEVSNIKYFKMEHTHENKTVIRCIALDVIIAQNQIYCSQYFTQNNFGKQ